MAESSTQRIAEVAVTVTEESERERERELKESA